MDNTLDQLRSLLRRKRSEEFYAQELGISIEEVKELKKIIRSENQPETNVETLSIDGTSYRENIDKGEVEIKGFYDHAPKPEEIIKDHQIDESKWKLSTFYSKSSSKGWAVTALFKNITKEEEALDKFQQFLSEYKSTYKPVDKKDIIQNPTFDRPSCLLLSLCDFHIGKLDVSMVSIEERLEQYKKTVDTLVHRAYHSHNIDEICFVLGNDLLQVDTIQGTTVKGTPVGQSMTWDKAYETAFTLMAETIEKLKQYCNKLTIVHIPGNHSQMNEYHISHALEVQFKADKNIVFQRSAEKYKVFVYGETALFLNHGDNIQDKLPLMFAQTFRKEWGNTKYHEIVLGDRHHNSEKTFKAVQGEAQGVRMRILPALTGTDQWHYDNLFTNSIQAGLALVYDKESGKISEFEHRI